MSPVNLSLGDERSGVTSPHHGQWSLVIPGAQGTPVSCAGPGQLSSPWVRSLVSGHHIGCLSVLSQCHTDSDVWCRCHERHDRIITQRGLTDLDLALPNPTSVKQSSIQNFSCIKSEMYNSGLRISRKSLQKPKHSFCVSFINQLGLYGGETMVRGLYLACAWLIMFLLLVQL